MNEEFLQYVWKFQLFHGELVTTQGDPIIVIKPGEHNPDAGPDFFNARIRIGPIVWNGNVEVHVRASDWLRHNHADNKRYDNIILHVVAEDDLTINRASSEQVPTLCMKHNLNMSMMASYHELKHARRWIPCEKLLGNVPSLNVSGMLDRMMVERLQRKSEQILSMFESCQFSWEEVTYVLCSRSFGTRINAQVFEWLARSVPYSLILRMRDRKFCLEALLFGQAGMLHEHFIDAYPIQLRVEYQFLRKKYDLTPLQDHLWNFLRLRPPSFPTIRIALLADLLYRQTNLFSQILEAKDVSDLFALFESECSEYWENHYLFDRQSRRQTKRLGNDSMELILINTAVPLLYSYGHYINNQKIKDHALELLHQVSGETNTITQKWATLGMGITDAWNTQALLELKEKYCDRKKCLQCHIGNSILTRSITPLNHDK